jgi:hypothetical protein
MAQNPDDSTKIAPAAPTEAGAEAKTPLRRRLFVLRLAAIGGAGSAAAACVPQQTPVYYAPAQVRRGTGISDSDPSDAPGQGRGGQRGSGVSDSDPNDAPGYGRGGQRATGISDSDPNDAPGRGRGGYRGNSGNRVRTGINDSDPSDGAGYGRGSVRRSGVSDSDPSDAPGRGRRGY